MFQLAMSAIFAARCAEPTSSFQHTFCRESQAEYASLVEDALASYKSRGLLVDEIFGLHGWDGDPQTVVVNNTILTVSEPHLNAAANLVPLLKDLSTKVFLPDLVLAANIMDQVSLHSSK